MDTISTDIASLAAIVAAYVGVVRGFGLPDKWIHFVAVAIAAVFVLVPDSIQTAIVTISVVGLAASGAYNFAKKPEAPADSKPQDNANNANGGV